MSEIWTITKLLDWCAEYFKSKSIDSARLDAELLLAHTLKFTRMQLYLNFDKPLAENELAAFKELVKRRARHEPVAYILGKKDFWSLEFNVREGVLVPRPDTEILIEDVLQRLQNRKQDHLTAFEVGIGSGAIAVTLLKELPNLRMTAIEISDAAISVSTENAQKHGVADRLQILKGDFLKDQNKIDSPEFDFIVSNPPYVTHDEIQTLPITIADFEPKEALDGGADGLDFYRALAPFAFSDLSENGFLSVEIGETQGQAVRDLFEGAGLANATVRKDYANLDRVVSANKG